MWNAERFDAIPIRKRRTTKITYAKAEELSDSSDIEDYEIETNEMDTSEVDEEYFTDDDNSDDDYFPYPT